jgi:hypothetical protein
VSPTMQRRASGGGVQSPGGEDSDIFHSTRLHSGSLTEDVVHQGEIPKVQPCCSAEVERMKWRIRFFFMDPIQKWRTRHHFPWKLFLQVIKIVFVTIQVFLLHLFKNSTVCSLLRNVASLYI